MLRHNTSLNKFKKIEIISSIFSDHNGMKLEINYNKKKTEKYSNTWRLQNITKQWVNNEIKEEIKSYLEANENEQTTTQNLGDTAKAVIRRSFTALQAYLRKQKKNLNLPLHFKELEKE